MALTLEVENFRCLERVKWSPEGVCALVGPNGAGKTTLLNALEFLAVYFSHDAVIAGMATADQLGRIRRFDAPAGEPLRLRIEVDNAAWEVLPSTKDGLTYLPLGERVYTGSDVVIHQRTANLEVEFFGQTSVRPNVSSERSALAFVESINPAGIERLRPLISTLRGYRRYDYARAARLREQGSTSSGETVLDASGANAFDVLRQWRAGSRDLAEKGEFVTDALREAFSGVFSGYDFVQAGPVVFARFYEPRFSEPIYPSAAPDGLMVGLLHLTAVASCPDGGVVAIDEFENGLHPHAIRSLLESIRARALQRRLTVILATHSPTLLNCFNAEPQRVFVIERSREPQPRALDRIKKREWLDHFALGDLYSGERIGGQQAAE